MPYGLYVSAEGAHSQSRRLEVIANNLANVDTPGFKRDVPLFKARLAEATQRGLDHAGSGSINDLGGGVVCDATLTDFSPGPVRDTGIPTDMAIDGNAFFVVQKGDQKLLTRAGNFAIQDDGTLVTRDGYPVLSDNGSPVLIPQDEGPWHLTPDGGVSQAGSVTLLGLVRPQSGGDLVKVGENLFAPLAPPQPLPIEERHLSHKQLEGSGVRPTIEMMEMIEASRAFESNTNMIHYHDQTMGNLINRILKEN